MRGSPPNTFFNFHSWRFSRAISDCLRLLAALDTSGRRAVRSENFALKDLRGAVRGVNGTQIQNQFEAEVPVELAALYSERDGAFFLNVEGAVENANLDELRNNNIALTRVRVLTKSQLEDFYLQRPVCE